MTIETIIRDYYVAFAVVASVALTMALWAVAMAARSVWRWVAGRRKRRALERSWATTAAQMAKAINEGPSDFKAEALPGGWVRLDWPKSETRVPAPDLALARYTVTMKRGATRDGTPAPYPDDLNLVARSEEPTPAPDLKYQGDQVSGIRKELMALEERVERLEKPPQPARYRVFMEPGGHLRLSDGAAVYFRGFAGWANSHVPLDILKGWSLCGLVTELAQDSPEYREIVASFEAWRKGQ